MTSRRRLERRIRTFSEVAEIMESMKTLSQIETRKLAGVLDFQRRVVDGIEAAARDFLAFHPELATPRTTEAEVWIVIGSDRGFCGDFNQALAAAVDRRTSEGTDRPIQLVLVGRKLVGVLPDSIRPAAALDGPSVVEDVPRLLVRIVEIVDGLVDTARPASLWLLHHGDERGALRTRAVLPPFREIGGAMPSLPYPPRLYLPPAQFYSELVDHYLFALLHEAFFLSLMAEHRRRVQHLDGAVKHLEDRTAELARRRNALRQEEITEEIELIMLSARNAAGR